MLKIPVYIPLAIWKPFSSIFRVFDTLFAYRAFRVHPWFGYPFFAFFFFLEHLVRPPMEVLTPRGIMLQATPHLKYWGGGGDGGGGYIPPIPRDRHPLCLCLESLSIFPLPIGGGGGATCLPCPPPPPVVTPLVQNATVTTCPCNN